MHITDTPLGTEAAPAPAPSDAVAPYRRKAADLVLDAIEELTGDRQLRHQLEPQAEVWAAGFGHDDFPSLMEWGARLHRASASIRQANLTLIEGEYEARRGLVVGVAS